METLGFGVQSPEDLEEFVLCSVGFVGRDKSEKV
jgi:hypothetical protein